MIRAISAYRSSAKLHQRGTGVVVFLCFFPPGKMYLRHAGGSCGSALRTIPDVFLRSPRISYPPRLPHVRDARYDFRQR